VRAAVEKPDAVTGSAITARHEIGRAIADRIRDLRSADDLSKVAEEVLPEIEKFLESPAEKRLRRIRFGVVMAAIGLGATLAFAWVGLSGKDEDMLALAGFGLVAFFLGLGVMFNGWHFTLPQQQLPERSPEGFPQAAPENWSESPTNPMSAEQQALFPSVTEHTTHQLPDNRLKAQQTR
jgi:hypothetical protein